MPSRPSDRHRRERGVRDDDTYSDDEYHERPRTTRRVSRSAHEPGTGDFGRSHRRRGGGYYDDDDDDDDYDASPVRRSVRSRSLDHRPNHRGRYPRYDAYSDSSDSEDDRRRRRHRRGGGDRGYTSGGGGGGSRRRDSIVSSSSRSRLQRRESDKSHILQAAASAAVVAGAAEAWRMRKDKSSWQKKGTKMATAAAGAAAIAAVNDKNPRDHGKKNAIGATIGGLLMNRLANGGRR